MIEWKATKAERALIQQIVQRAQNDGFAYDPSEMEMDLEACHSNGTPLDFQKMLAFPDFDFYHDLYGIRRHLNRQTGQLDNRFLPRCSKK